MRQRSTTTKRERGVMGRATRRARAACAGLGWIAGMEPGTGLEEATTRGASACYDWHMADDERRARADARRLRAVLHKGTLQAREHDLDPISGAAALSLVTRLTAESWSLSGLPWPSYSRHEVPHRFVRWRCS